MISVDANVLVRLVTNDDPVQSRQAARLSAEQDIFVPRTVLLEVEWVLRMDFADALHVAGSVPSADCFYTFDKAFARRARKLGTAPVVELA